MRKSIIVTALLLGAFTSLGVAPSMAAPRKVAVRSHVQLHKPVRTIAAARVKRGPTTRGYARLQPDTELAPLLASVFGLAAQYGYDVPTYRADRVRVTHRRSAAPADSSSYDSGPSDTSSSSSSSDSGADASAAAAAIQASNDENALNASTAAAEQQNEAAQAAATQTEINANNN